MTDAELKTALREARALLSAGRSAEGERLLVQLRAVRPDSPEVAIVLARAQQARGDRGAAITVLADASTRNPGHETLAVELAMTRAQAGERRAAAEGLAAWVAGQSQAPFAWLVLAQLHDELGATDAALLARFEAVTRAQAMGVWRSPEETPPHLLDAVARAVREVHAGRQALFQAALAPLEAEHGAPALARVQRALRAYLGTEPASPPDPMQRPRFFYFPDLPPGPWHDPMLHPWAPRLAAAFEDLRAEARAMIIEGAGLQDFVEVRDGDRIQNYLGGVKPAWEAFFFYRHGERFGDNHRRCPKTSAVLESIDLARIPGQTPEICFSVLSPGTTILPHVGVTNTRLVMHLPLMVPEDCALHVVDRGEHHWQEGRLMMFDDTYLHEAWNRSTSPRVILLMDCWNPHLTPAERAGVSVIAQRIGLLDRALDIRPWVG